MKKNSTNLVLFRALMGHPVKKYIFFALIKKSFYKPLLKLFLNIIKFIFIVLGPPYKHPPPPWIPMDYGSDYVKYQIYS